MARGIQPGDKAPDFTLPSQNGDPGVRGCRQFMITEKKQRIRLRIFRDRTIFRDNFWPYRAYRAAAVRQESRVYLVNNGKNGGNNRRSGHVTDG